ncbi:CoA transferase subunit A [Halomicroarcula sp. F13]|uniref:CoA transferase subunit A n=1 Tax=Haloarcula rubra TaxID=2487747 RepID=A0AAW4PXE3_9EURY|nr:CoA-transferase [Halomicroarcula rubra]MBX0325329.1 CoA transferase subunit A [Halomicroarcula rubra]
MPDTKVRDLSAAIEMIEPGSSIAMGLALEHAIPFAAGHELIRQGTDDLTLIGPISDLLFDQLVAADLVDRVRAAWVGNVSAGTGYNFRRAVEDGDLEVENHSNFSIALSLKAAAMGVPYLPTRSLLGSDIFDESDRFREAEDPYSGDRLALVPAIRPDWAIVHVQRASPYGDAHFWGNSGVTFEGVKAAKNTLVVAEEIVDSDVIKSDPSRTAITRESVTTVAEVPYGAHPSPLAGRYNRDNEYYVDYAERTNDLADAADWLEEWVYSVPDRTTYMEKIERNLSVSEPTVAAEVEYGK